MTRETIYENKNGKVIKTSDGNWFYYSIFTLSVRNEDGIYSVDWNEKEQISSNGFITNCTSSRVINERCRLKTEDEIIKYAINYLSK